jgi:2',3'-cyclic-nucleotide 2'-phosphodiesterase (5'-nucleotidase family)
MNTAVLARRLSWVPLIAWLAVLAVGCTTTLQVQEAKPTLYSVSDSYANKPSIEASIAPYRNRMSATMSDTIGFCTRELRKGFPEGLLNNWTSDILLASGREQIEPGIDISLLNNGGLRVPIAAGPVTLGKIYELQPFDNIVVVLTLEPAQMDSMLQAIAKAKSESGHSFGGLRIKTDKQQLTEVLINGKPWDRAKSYRIITIDYLADGGSNMSMLRRAKNINNTGIFIRDFIADYIRREKAAGRVIDAQLDGRFTASSPSAD